MELKDIVAISTLGGLFEVITQRNDGLIVRPLDEKDSKFVSNRVHVFTPLDGITIFTTDDTIELVKVLPEMKKQEKTNPLVDAKASSDELKKYFKKIVPDYDEERVYVSDIKKILKWYQILTQHNLLPEPEVKKKEAKAEKKDKKTVKAKPKAKKAAKPKAEKE